MHEVTLVPNATSLSQSMRDIGYSLETAIADLIDNSISAGAKIIHIVFDRSESSDPCLAVIDDGSGMTKDVALEAMRPGSGNPRTKRTSGDLGRFGLGLKTASFSQCRSMTLITRKNNSTFAARWDLDLITVRNEWVVQVLSDDEIQYLPFVDQIGKHGTCILWSKLDRLLENQQYYASQIDIYSFLEHVEHHLALIYHRYLSGEFKKQKITITVNGHSVEPFDPFCTSHKATQMLPEEILPIDGQQVRIQPFILPHHSKLTKADYNFYRSRNDFYSNQGIYVYRNGRLMAWGDWFRLVPKTEATKLARVRIDFPNALDEQWTIDIKKSRAHPPPQVREKLRQIINKITTQSKRVHTGRGDRLFNKQEQPVWIRSADREGTRYGINREHPLFVALAQQTDPQLMRALDQIFAVIEREVPIEAIYADYSTVPEVFDDVPDIPVENLPEILETFAGLFRVAGKLDKDNLRKAIIHIPPFNQHREATLKIIEDLI